MMKRTEKETQEGFTLIEILIAITVFTIGVMAVLLMKTAAVKSNALSIKQTLASELATTTAERFMEIPYTDTALAVTSGPQTIPNDGSLAWPFDITYGDAYSISYEIANGTAEANTRIITISVDWLANGVNHTGLEVRLLRAADL